MDQPTRRPTLDDLHAVRRLMERARKRGDRAAMLILEPQLVRLTSTFGAAS